MTPAEFQEELPPEEDLSAPTGREITCTVVGLTFMDRYRNLEGLRVGDELQLVREPFNELNAWAVMVFDQAFQQLGYLPQSVAHWVAPVMDRGSRVSACVKKIKGGDVPYYRRLIIQLSMG